MLDTSQDLFYIVLAFGILWVSLGMFWVLWYLGRILREFFTITKDVRQSVKKIEELADTMKEKIENSGHHFTLAIEGARQLIELYHKRSESKKKKTSEKKS